MGRMGGEVIDLCSEDEENENEKKPPAVTKKRIGRPVDTHAAEDQAKRRKLTSKNSCDLAASPAASAASNTALNVVPLVFLKSEDNATLTLLDTDASSRCFTSKSSAFKVSTIGTQQQMIHIHQPDRWSCGFRNWQMILSFLIPRLPPDHSYFRSSVLSEEFSQEFYQVPSVHDLQSFMERGWENGFDTDGARHYHQKIVGKAAWIGAIEVSGCLSFMGMDNVVVQFIRCPQSREELGPFCIKYFTTKDTNGCSRCGASQSARMKASALLSSLFKTAGDTTPLPCSCGLKLPLYLQWEGHSVTIIGVEESTNGNKLLVLNPAKSGQTIANALRNNKLASFRLPLAHLHKRDTQILLTSMCSLSATEQEQLKGRAQALTAAQGHVQRLLGR